MAIKGAALLRVVEGAQAGETFSVEIRPGERLTIGRARDNGICLHDTEVSRRHALLSFDGVRFGLADNRSTNGTYVNGAFAPEVTLHTGDEIRIGETTLIFEEATTRSEGTAIASDSIRLVGEDEPSGSASNVNLTLALSNREATQAPPARHTLEELKAAHERLSVLHEVNHAVVSAIDSQHMLASTMEQLVKLRDFEHGVILLYNDAGELEPRVEHRRRGAADSQIIGVSRTVLERSVQERMAVLCSDLQNDPRFGAAESVRLGNVRSAICVPLVGNNEVLGVLYLDSESLHEAFTEHDLRLFSTIANDVAIALANQRMRERLLERQRFEHELEIASQIQQNFLPTQVPADPRIKLRARNVPALEVGGDFYDYFNLGNGRFGVVIGDVSGKGVPAALMMVKAMGDFRTLAHDCCESPAKAVEALNQQLIASRTRGMFLTLAYCILDAERMHLWYTNAGHLPPMLVRAGGEVEELARAHGVPVGILAGSSYDEEVVPLQPGNVLFLTTDGVTEARNGAQEEFGEERVRDILRRNHHDPDALVAAVFRETLAFTGPARRHDDLTAVAVRIG